MKFGQSENPEVIDSRLPADDPHKAEILKQNDTSKHPLRWSKRSPKRPRTLGRLDQPAQNLDGSGNPGYLFLCSSKYRAGIAISFGLFY